MSKSNCLSCISQDKGKSWVSEFVSQRLSIDPVRISQQEVIQTQEMIKCMQLRAKDDHSQRSDIKIYTCKETEIIHLGAFSRKVTPLEKKLKLYFFTGIFRCNSLCRILGILKSSLIFMTQLDLYFSITSIRPRKIQSAQ